MKVFEQILAPLRRPLLTARYPRARPELSVRRTRGTPAHLAERCDQERVCAEVCPVDAITVDAVAWKLDYGKCTFCGECVRACPSGAIAATDEFELATRSRGATVVTEQLDGGSDG